MERSLTLDPMCKIKASRPPLAESNLPAFPPSCRPVFSANTFSDILPLSLHDALPILPALSFCTFLAPNRGLQICTPTGGCGQKKRRLAEKLLTEKLRRLRMEHASSGFAGSSVVCIAGRLRTLQWRGH